MPQDVDLSNTAKDDRYKRLRDAHEAGKKLTEQEMRILQHAAVCRGEKLD